jgi:glycosyltransferase involved in cell wall biosynthesis
MPKVSIVLPSYNYARYLDERIQSLLAQTYTDFELIIVDDASTDNSVDIIKKYTSDHRIKTHFFEQNSGLPYKRWNDGADFAEGKYILFAGADDSCHPRMLEELVACMDANSNVGIAYTQSLEIDSESKVIRSLLYRTNDLDKERWKHDYINNGKDECRYLVVKNTLPNASSILLRRTVFEEAGRFDEQLRLVADWMLWAKILLISDVAYIAEPLNYFRVHRKTVRSKTRGDGNHIEEYYRVLSFISENVELPSISIERAYNRLVNRWVNSTLRMILTKPRQAASKAQFFYHTASRLDTKVNHRLLKRFIKDIFTFGLLSLKERAAQ